MEEKVLQNEMPSTLSWLPCITIAFCENIDLKFNSTNWLFCSRQSSCIFFFSTYHPTALFVKSKWKRLIYWIGYIETSNVVIKLNCSIISCSIKFDCFSILLLHSILDFWHMHNCFLFRCDGFVIELVSTMSFSFFFFHSISNYFPVWRRLK